MSAIRQKRTADQIQIILSELLLREVRDPRLQMITITDVKIDRELQYADIYINAFGEDSRQKEILAALEQAASFLRRGLSSRIRLRVVPHLHFHWDPSLAHAEAIHAILADLDIPEAEPEAENETEAVAENGHEREDENGDEERAIPDAEGMEDE